MVTWPLCSWLFQARKFRRFGFSLCVVANATLTLRVRVRMCDHARGRKTLQFHAVVKYMLKLCGTALYCTILREVAAKITQHYAHYVRKGTCVHVRSCNQYECSHRNQRVRLQRKRACTCVVWVRLKRYILQQKCQQKWIGNVFLWTWRCNFQPPTPTLSATMHCVTNKQTDGPTTVWCQ